MISSQNKVFDFIKEKDNTRLLDLPKDDLQLFLILIDDYKLSLRKKLGIEEKVTFGMEIEIDNVNIDKILELYDNLPNEDWKIEEDDSVPNGKEIKTPPLKDKEETWIDLNNVCKRVSELGEITNRCGGHIHIGTHILDDNIEAWKNLLLLWSAYENIIFRFGYGEYLSARLNIDANACPVAKKLERQYYEILEYNFDIPTELMILKFERTVALNFMNVAYKDYSKYEKENTIEIRNSNATDKAVIWQNYTNFYVKLFQYCNRKDFDFETVYKRLKKNKELDINFDFYKYIYLEQAFELADLIFDNNLDKVYFLRQYLKSLEISNSYKQEKAKVFIK